MIKSSVVLIPGTSYHTHLRRFDHYSTCAIMNERFRISCIMDSEKFVYTGKIFYYGIKILKDFTFLSKKIQIRYDYV